MYGRKTIGLFFVYLNYTTILLHITFLGAYKHEERPEKTQQEGAVLSGSQRARETESYRFEPSRRDCRGIATRGRVVCQDMLIIFIPIEWAICGGLVMKVPTAVLLLKGLVTELIQSDVHSDRSVVRNQSGFIKSRRRIR